MKVALYPGTFDPVTLGHVDIVQRGARMFDRVLVAVARSSSKNPLFSLDERVDLLRRTFDSLDNVEVIGYERQLTVHLMREKGAIVLLRGLRAVSDFEYEMQLASMNRAMEPEYDSVFLPPEDTFSSISSSLVKEIASLGGAVEQFVPPATAQALREKFPAKN